ncbi:MAG TPA: hypothetical protein VNZ49_11890 [Bacteroidia bacterium]|jgi:hypothetical protein|nr:hypothetical protein [Bacteroidia bacterium]
MIHDLSEEQKENIQTAFLHRQEEQHEQELVELKKKPKTSKRNFEILNKELARPVCNKCTAVIRLYEMPKFFRNGGHCESCSKNI